MELFVESDVQPEALSGERIAVLGYGSQGRAHALNLRDSGYDVVVGLRPGGKTSARAENDGFDVKTFEEAAEGAGLIAFLTPRHGSSGDLRADPATDQGKRDHPVRARVQYPLFADQTPRGSGCRADSAEGAG